MDPERQKFIEAYAEKIKYDPHWRKQHNAFIDAQIKRANEFYKKLVLSENGKEKLKKVTHASDAFIEEFYSYCMSQKN